MVENAAAASGFGEILGGAGMVIEPDLGVAFGYPLADLLRTVLFLLGQGWQYDRDLARILVERGHVQCLLKLVITLNIYSNF